jgi:circadian clock protein KaiC
VKYRGSHHGTNEYPFLIEAEGLSVLPVTSLTLQHEVSSERVPSGLPALDEMLGGRGFFRGSTVLITGTAGTGKTTFAAHFVDAACRQGERSLYFLFEESPQQMVRNMHSVGLDLDQWTRAGTLRLHADRPSRHGLEMHLAVLHRLVEETRPSIVVVDPMTSLPSVGTTIDVRTMLTRMIDFLKARGVTAMFTSLTSAGHDPEMTEASISSLMDSWLVTSAEVADRRRRRWISVLKSRGMAHSDVIREFRFTDHGIELLPEPLADRSSR